MSQNDSSRLSGSAASSVDYEGLFRRSQAVLMRLLLSSGAVWAAFQQDTVLRDELRQQMDEIRRIGGSGANSAVLIACAEKMNEINGEMWRSDPNRLKVSSFDAHETIVKYPDLNSDNIYYFRIIGSEVTVLLIEEGTGSK